MFTAITVTRTMLHLVVNFPWARSEKAFGLNISWLSNRFHDGRVLDVYGKRRVYFGFSIALLAAGLAFLATGGLKPGIDFTGGSEVSATFNQDLKTEDVQPGSSATLTINAPAGTYDFICSIPGHADAGMRGKLTVQ